MGVDERLRRTAETQAPRGMAPMASGARDTEAPASPGPEEFSTPDFKNSKGADGGG
jgi:hypothetical protein